MPLNADFSPMASQDASPTIQYTVSKTPAGDQVKVTVKVTSTAGVGQKTWTQQIESSGHRIEGNFGGEFGQTALEVPSPEMDWSGEIHLLVPGEGGGPNGLYTVEPGRIECVDRPLRHRVSGITGCHQAGQARGRWRADR